MLTGGEEFSCIFNPTQGFFADTRRCADELFNWATTAPVIVQREYFKSFFKEHPDDFIIHIAFSENCIITRNAWKQLEPKLRDRVLIIPVCPGGFITDDLSMNANHILSENDPVPLADVGGMRRCKQTTIMVRPKIPRGIFEHELRNPELKTPIQRQYEKHVGEINDLLRRGL
jgi:hypothetical protein